MISQCIGRSGKAQSMGGGMGLDGLEKIDKFFPPASGISFLIFPQPWVQDWSAFFRYSHDTDEWRL